MRCFFLTLLLVVGCAHAPRRHYDINGAAYPTERKHAPCCCRGQTTP